MINNSNMVHHLNFNDKEITLIGTAHVSRDSVQLVADIISEQRPDTVSIELCESRYQSIRYKDQWQDTDIVKVIKERVLC